MQNGFIVLHRKMINWEWFSDINTSHLFLYCLLRANHKAEKWRGEFIDRGSFVTSLEHLSKDTGLSIRQVRTALNKLKTTGELTSKTTSRYSIISIKNYCQYQDYDKQLDKQMTNKRQTDDKQATTNNNDNNDNNDNNVVVESEIEKQKILNNFYGEFKNVFLNDSDYGKICGCVNNSAILKELLDELSNKIAQNDEKYKPYNENFPSAHYSHLMKFWKYRQAHPEKFIKTDNNGGIDDYSAALQRGIEMYRQKKREKAKPL